MKSFKECSKLTWQCRIYKTILNSNFFYSLSTFTYDKQIKGKELKITRYYK